MITRFAPSPTGALHLGNARTFLLNWLIARKRGWKILLRIEDIDGPRIRKDADLQAIEDLKWLGLDWDSPPIYQSARLSIYTDVVRQLVGEGKAYPCVCSRKEVELAASAPHAEDGAVVYPGTCRGRFHTIEEATRFAGHPPAIRFQVPDKTINWIDEFAGPQQCNPATQLGDFVITKADGTPAYQLAVVVDDAAEGVTDVVRGDDLLDSTPRQILLYNAIGISNIPKYFHLPLVVGEDGKRLAKRHGDTRLSYYRDRGVSSLRMLSLLARWCGIDFEKPDVTLASLLETFDLNRVPHTRVTFAKSDDAWLLGRV